MGVLSIGKFRYSGGKVQELYIPNSKGYLGKEREERVLRLRYIQSLLSPHISFHVG